MKNVYMDDRYMFDEEMIGILGQLLDDNEDDVEMSEKVRKGISDVYNALCFRYFECNENIKCEEVESYD